MKNELSAIDPNFKVNTELNESDIRFYDVKESPFRIYGVFFENGKFRRMPEDVAKAVSSGTWSLHSRTAGGRIRFRTDSPYVAIHAKMPKILRGPHSTLCGSAGFDLYLYEEMDRYFGTFTPPYDMEDGYESILRFPSSKMREVTINLPLYSEVSELYVGLSETATVCVPTPYKIETPIVYYGSSITQGGCASRSGSSYPSIVARRLNADYVNLGFSGNAKGEVEIAEYISNLEMSAFVYDYDFNAPTPEYLQETHERMFRIIREKNPTLPILMMSKPRYYLTAVDEKRLEIIRTTYRNAIESGDKNVYMLDGRQLMQLCRGEGTVDNVHPTDFGFASMAIAVGDVLEKIFE